LAASQSPQASAPSAVTTCRARAMRFVHANARTHTYVIHRIRTRTRTHVRTRTHMYMRVLYVAFVPCSAAGAMSLEHLHAHTRPRAVSLCSAYPSRYNLEVHATSAHHALHTLHAFYGLHLCSTPAGMHVHSTHFDFTRRNGEMSLRAESGPLHRRRVGKTRRFIGYEESETSARISVRASWAADRAALSASGDHLQRHSR
jgi:hypothetical protein